MLSHGRIRFRRRATSSLQSCAKDCSRMQQNFEAALLNQNQSAEKRDADPNGLKRYAEANTKLLPPSKAPRVVFLGDSITDAWRLNEYFTGRDFVNRGIGGQTTLQMLARFRQDVEAVNPRAVVVLGGTNDIAAGVSVNQIEENLATMGELAKAQGDQDGDCLDIAGERLPQRFGPGLRDDPESAAGDDPGDQSVAQELLPERGTGLSGLLLSMVDSAGCKPICRMTDCTRTRKVTG